MEKLEQFRSEINELDKELVRIVGQRLGICRDVAVYKRDTGIPMMQNAQVGTVKQRAADRGLEYDLRPDFMRELYTLIIDEACRIEDEIIDAEVEAPQADSTG